MDSTEPSQMQPNWCRSGKIKRNLAAHFHIIRTRNNAFRPHHLLSPSGNLRNTRPSRPGLPALQLIPA